MPTCFHVLMSDSAGGVSEGSDSESAGERARLWRGGGGGEGSCGERVGKGGGEGAPWKM